MLGKFVSVVDCQCMDLTFDLTEQRQAKKQANDRGFRGKYAPVMAHGRHRGNDFTGSEAKRAGQIHPINRGLFGFLRIVMRIIIFKRSLGD